MILRELITSLPKVTVSGLLDVEIGGISASSREIVPGGLFAAIRGSTHDGHRHIASALEAGAGAVLAEQAPPVDLDPSVTWLHVPDSRASLAALAGKFFHQPWRNMKLAGVTGTNGKTTVTFLLHHVMKQVWHRAGMLGTVQIDDGENVSVATHTTPGSLELNGLLARMRDHGCRGVAMEVSSHGIDQERIAGIGFDAAVFTNLSQDHLDYHGSMDAYFAAKAKWFRDLAADPRGKQPVAVINVDDKFGEALAAELSGRMPVVRFGFGLRSDFKANNFRQSARGLEFELTAKGKTFRVVAPLIGRFNVYNLLACLAAADVCGLRPRQAIAALAEAPQVPGRMEHIGSAGGTVAFVDYAHTPDALENACRTLRELQPRRLITVFGCGGDRDMSKRPQMAAAAARHSDALIVTSDNPRSEDPAEIIRQIIPGLRGAAHVVVEDRAEAISYAVRNALSGDIVLIAGKGHEAYQILKTGTIPFDDRKHASKALRDRAQDISDRR